MEVAIGKYKILREIGKGGMGIVYKALDSTTQKSVAIKVLPPTMVDRVTVERFNREIHAMSRLQHPNVLKVYDFGMTKGKHYFAMEFVEGESLKAMIRRKGSLSIKETLDIVSQVGDALAYAHKEGMIHRDIKPGNIMITKKGEVKVMDFGLVQIAGITRVTAEGSAVGTPEYMSPEQITDGEVDSRTDIYSLGVVMYEMLTGHPPFEANTYQAIMMKHKYETPPPISKLRPEVPLELEKIVMKTMAKNVVHRYQKIEELLNDINRLKGMQSQMETEAYGIHPFIGVANSKYKGKLKKRLFHVTIITVILALLAWLGYRYRVDIYSFLYNIGLETSIVLKGKSILVEEAEHHLKRLEMADEYHTIGLKFYREGLIDRAIAEYKKAIRLRPCCAVYYRDLAFAYEQKKENKKAIQALEDSLRYDQSSPEAEIVRQHLARLKRLR
jgi:serine/threonine protein kinase